MEKAVVLNVTEIHLEDKQIETKEGKPPRTFAIHTFLQDYNLMLLKVVAWTFEILQSNISGTWRSQNYNLCAISSLQSHKETGKEAA